MKELRKLLKVQTEHWTSTINNEKMQRQRFETVKEAEIVRGRVQSCNYRSDILYWRYKGALPQRGLTFLAFLLLQKRNDKLQPFWP